MRQTRLDTRIGGHPRYVYCDEWELMQVPPDILKCVCFVEARAGSEWKLVGTAFFLSRPLEGIHPAVNPEPYVVYAVTAKHVLQIAPSKPGGGDEEPWWYDDARLRMNTVDGKIDYLPVPPESWFPHPLSDTAVIRIAAPQDYFDLRYYPSQSYVNGEFFSKYQVTPGDEVLMMGLLSVHPGTKAVTPIVRVGNIALFSDDPISMETGDEPGVLIEARSFGGLSGSPAFLSLPIWRRADWGRGEPVAWQGESGNAGPNFLLGIVNGWFPNHEPESQARHALNTGITAVIPAARIAEILDCDAFQDEREAIVKLENEKAPRVRPATIGNGENAAHAPEQNQEFGRFEDLARKLINTPKPKPEEKSSQ